MKIIESIVDLFTSLKLTVFCLVAAIVLVFVGTLAQVDLGLYQAQEKYFRSLFVYWSPGESELQIPILPGGYLLGFVLLLNLIGAHLKRFQFSSKKAGIFIIHAGLIILLLGQFFTEVFQVESAMRLTEGQTKNYSENQRNTELVVVTSGEETDRVISFHQKMLKSHIMIEHPELPFKIKINQWIPNSIIAERGPNAPPATRGLGLSYDVHGVPLTYKMDERNVPSAIVELIGDEGSLGTWLVSFYFDRLQTVEYEGKEYKIGLRLIRYYKPYTMHLIDFRHDKYMGTDIPKNFSSRVRVRNPETEEDKEVLIYMNNPLRYEGETYYQAGFDENDDRVTILQVVRNPSWLVPYISCILVSLGLIVQFGFHFNKFLRKRKA